MNTCVPRLALSVVLVFGHAVLAAQTVVTYGSGENKTAAIVLDAAGNPVTLNVATGTATQSGNISESGGSFGFAKNGAGALVLTGSNSYTGSTLLAGGTLQSATTGSIGTGLVYIGATGQLQLMGGTHNIAGLVFNQSGEPTGAGPFLVVSGGAVLNNTGAIEATYPDNADNGFLVTGAGSRLTASHLSGDGATFTLADGGTLQFTNTSSPGQVREFNIGGSVGEAAAAPGFLSLASDGPVVVGTARFNHTSSDYWFTSDGTATGKAFELNGDYFISAGTTIFKDTTTNTGGTLHVDGGEARFTSPVRSSFVFLSINNGGTATFAANPFRDLGNTFSLNNGTFHATESFTIPVNRTDRQFQSTGGSFVVDSGKTLTLATEHNAFGYDLVGQAVNGTGSFTKQGAGTLVLERDYTPIDLGVPDFTVRQGTLRTPAYVFDEVIAGKQAGDVGTLTVAPTNVSTWSAGVPLSLGFMYANYWTPSSYGPPILAEFDASGSLQTDQYLVPAAQSRSLMLGEQAGATGNLTLNEGAAGGWYVDNGLAVIGGAGTGNVTLTAGHFLYNNGHDIVLGQSAGGVGTVTVSGANAQLNAGLDLTPLDPFDYSGHGGETPEIDRGIGNLIIGQGGTGHVTVTNNARILAEQTFIGNGSDLTLGSGGSIIGGFTAQNGSTVHALNGARFAYTLAAISEASSFANGSTLLVDTGAGLNFDFTQGSGFGLGSYTLFDFSAGSTITGLDTASLFATGLDGFGYTFDLSASHLNLNVTPVPEPSTYALLAGGLGLGLVFHLRRRRPLSF